MPSQNVYLTLPTAAAMNVPWPVSDNTYTRYVTIDCAYWLSYVFATAITAVSLDSAAGVTISNLAFASKQITFTQTGGAAGSNNAVQISITVDGTRREVLSFEVPVAVVTSNAFIYSRLAHAIFVTPTGTTYAAQTDLSSEITRATGAETTEQTARAAETARATAAETTEAGLRAAETTRATAAETAEVTRATGAETAESTARQSDEVILLNEINRSTTADTSFKASLSYTTLSDFNPVGDGSTDDRATLVSAITAAMSLAAGGQPNRVWDLVIPAGNYAISSPINIRDTTGVGINLRIVGHGGPVLKATGTSGGLFSINGNNVTIEDIVFDGNKTAHASDFTACVTIDGTTYATSKINIRRCKFVNPNGGISATAASRLNIVDNDIQASKLHSVYLNGCYDSIVTRNYLDNAGGFGVILTNGCYRNYIEGNKCLTNAIELVGITQDGYENKVINNHAEGTGDNGISCTGYKNIIMGNTAKGCQGNGIELYGERNLCVGNTCLNNAKGNAGNAGWRGGIALQGGFGGISQCNTVVGNICDDDQATPTQVYGIWLGLTSYTLWATGQTIAATTGSPVYRYYGSNLYKATANGTTGSTPLTHTSGTVSDGNVQWTFVRPILAGSPGTFQNEISSNNIARFGTAKYLDASGATGSNVNEISASFQPLVLPANLTAGVISNAGGLASVTVTGSSYSVLNGSGTTLAVSAPAISGGQQAAAGVTQFTLYGFGTVATGGSGYVVNDIVTLVGGTPSGIASKLKVVTVDGNGAILTFTATGAAGGFTYTALPNAGNSAFSGGTGTGFTLTGTIWHIVTIAVTASGSGYTSPPTIALSGLTGTPGFVATTSAQMQLNAGAGFITLDSAGTHLGINGSGGSPVIDEGARIDGSGVRVTLVSGTAFTLPANASLIKLIQSSAISYGSIVLPAAVHDGQEIEIVNVGAAISSFNFTTTAVFGFTNGQPLGFGQKIKVVYDATDLKWYASTSIDLPQTVQSFGRNLVQNSIMRVNQRAVSTVSASGGYPVDRWLHTDAAAGTRIVNQVALTDSDKSITEELFTNGIRIQTTGSSGASDFELVSHRIEGLRSTAGKPLVVSFYAKAATAGQVISTELQQVFGTGGSPSATVNALGVVKFTLTTSLTRYFLYVTPPSVIGKTFGVGDYLELDFWTSSGSSFNARNGTIGVQTSDITVTGVQVELGAFPTPIERVGLSIELMQCQRFCQFYPSLFISGYNSTSGGVFLEAVCSVPMRAVPTVTYNNQTNNNTTTFTTDLATTTHVRHKTIVTATGGATATADVLLTADL